jgi:hypothetical protein
MTPGICFGGRVLSALSVNIDPKNKTALPDGLDLWISD